MVIGKGYTVIEVSYEVANKVGGIYTVLATKAETMAERNENYITIGPYYEKNAAVDFEETDPGELGDVFDKLKREYGIICRYGKWLVDGKPVCILIEPGAFRAKVNEIKGQMWEQHKVDSLFTDGWYDEPLPWSRSVGIVIDELEKTGKLGTVIAHFHEWLSGAGLLYLRHNNQKVKTVFTTHATVVGRTIAGIGKEDLYELIRTGLSSGQTISDEKVKEYNCTAKHTMEKASALNCHVFTTVSETVAPECEYILGRKPDVILMNGLNMERFPLMENLSSLHIHLRNRVRKFCMSYFSPYYEFDAKETLFYFISGRFEMRNKGVDVFIDSLGKLNEKLKKSKSKKNIVVFIWVPERTMERKRSVLENIALFEHMENVVEKEAVQIERRIIEAFAKGESSPRMNVFDESFLQDLKKMELVLKSKHDQVPPITPFDLFSENSITEALRKNNLNNKKEDRIKVIYYPAYLSTTDGLLGMNYYDAMIACHLGVFPSYYESWGYTPLESAALGLQSVTTDLSGFGKFILPKLEKNEMAMFVLKRENTPYEDTVNQLTDILYRVYMMSKQQRGKQKIKAKQLSMLADWSVLINNYQHAYQIALGK